MADQVEKIKYLGCPTIILWSCTSYIWEGNISWDRRLGLGLNLMYKVLVESILLCDMLRK